MPLYFVNNEKLIVVEFARHNVRDTTWLSASMQVALEKIQIWYTLLIFNLSVSLGNHLSALI